MRLDRGEAQGTGLALLLHLALVAALTVNLAQAPAVPEPPAMAVEFVDSDDIALAAAAPAPAVPAAAASSPAEPSPPEPAQAPAPPQPLAPSISAPVARPVPAIRPAPPRQSRIGDDFLAGVPDATPSPRPPAQGAATFSAAAKASVDGAIKRQIQPCADRQPALGPGADRIRVAVNLRLDRSGRLSRPPALVRTSGVDEDNQRFEDLAFDQAVAVFRACAPLRLPPELYSTPQGGWGNITMTYRAK